MTEVSSMSENEGRRPSSLPPPPSERLPQPPAIFISDTEEITQRRKNGRKVKKNNTVPGVTMEARRVLEHLLRRSLSDAPAMSDSSGGLPDPCHPAPPASGGSSRFSHSGELTHQSVMDKLMKDKMLELSLSEMSHDEPDYVYTHELVRRPLSLSSQSSGGKHVRTGSITDSPVSYTTSGSKMSNQSPKLLRQTQTTTTTSHSSHKHNLPEALLYHEDEDASSTSTEDYEYTDPSEFLRRKKKSFLRRHTERIMHTFRRRKQRPLDLTELECCQEDSSPHKCNKKKKKGAATANTTKITSPFKRMRTQTEPCESSQRLHVGSMQQQVPGTAASSPEHVTHYTDIEQFHEESLRRATRAHWVTSSARGQELGHFSDGGRDKGLLDNLIRSIRKRSSFRAKRGKHDGKDTLCHSEENLRMRALTPDQHDILRRCDVTHHVEIGSDSDVHGAQSWREKLSQRIEAQMGEADTVQTTRVTSQSTRTGDINIPVVHAAGRVSSQVEEPDYDEIEDQDELDGFMDKISDLCSSKPFHERSVSEKDIMYERIADQLCAIADHYNMGSPRSQKNSPTEPVADLLMESSGSSELEGAAARKPDVVEPEATDVEKELAAMLRAKGDAATSSMPAMTPLVENLVQSVSYSDFQQLLGENLGGKPGWHQVAMMFRLTQTAVQFSGVGTSGAARIKENTLKYFEDRMAGWIVKQGGWESVVDDTSSELD